jgi:hypothetical protein
MWQMVLLRGLSESVGGIRLSDCLLDYLRIRAFYFSPQKWQSSNVIATASTVLLEPKVVSPVTLVV